jgi:hypothetical protein
MKSLMTAAMVLTLTALTGCTQGEPGGPGTAAAPEKQATVGQTDDTFNLSVPLTSTSLQQGGQTEATIGINRAKNFDEDVALHFADVPQGVTIDPASPVIKHGDENVKVTFQAADESALGDFTVKVTGHPTNGSDALVDFKLGVVAMESFSVSLPLLSTTLKQGQSETVSISINRDKNFDQDVTLMFGEMPAGVTVAPADPVIKAGETEAQITLTAVADAALGDFTVKVTGHPAKGADTMNDLKLSVVKE